jgi:hypothetical protein
MREADLAPLSALVTLSKLGIWGTISMDTEGPSFINLSRALTQLTSLTLRNSNLHKLWGLSELKYVQELDLSYNSTRIALADLPAMPSLTKLTFAGNWVMRDSPSFLTTLSKLQHLSMRDCYSADAVSPLASLASLTRLEVVPKGVTRDWTRCALITAIGPLQQLHHLVISSDFKQADPISSFSVLGTLQHLTHLELRGPQLPAGALAAMLSTAQEDAGAACLPRLQCLEIHTLDEEEIAEEDWQAPGGSISGSEIALLARSCPELQSLTIDGYPLEDAGSSTLMSGLTGLTALTCRVTNSGKSTHWPNFPVA